MGACTEPDPHKNAQACISVKQLQPQENLQQDQQIGLVLRERESTSGITYSGIWEQNANFAGPGVVGVQIASVPLVIFKHYRDNAALTALYAIELKECPRGCFVQGHVF